MILGMYVTRSKQHVWFIGDPLENILGAKLPSGRDVMRNLVHYHRVKNVNIQDAANRVYTQIIPMWEKARIPTKAKQDVNCTTNVNCWTSIVNEPPRRICAIKSNTQERCTPCSILHTPTLTSSSRSTRIGSFFTNNKWTGLDRLGRLTKALLFVSALPQLLLGPRIRREPPRDTPPRSKPPTETDAHGLIVTNAQVHHIYVYIYYIYTTCHWVNVLCYYCSSRM